MEVDWWWDEDFRVVVLASWFLRIGDGKALAVEILSAKLRL